MVQRPLPQRDRVHHHDDGAREDARGSQARDGASDDERIRVVGRAADSGPDFEDENGAQEDYFGGIEGVDFAEEELEGAIREEVGATVPADVGDGVEVVSDAGDGGCDYCLVLLSLSIGKRGSGGGGMGIGGDVRGLLGIRRGRVLVK